MGHMKECLQLVSTKWTGMTSINPIMNGPLYKMLKSSERKSKIWSLK